MFTLLLIFLFGVAAGCVLGLGISDRFDKSDEHERD